MEQTTELVQVAPVSDCLAVLATPPRSPVRRRAARLTRRGRVVAALTGLVVAVALLTIVVVLTHGGPVRSDPPADGSRVAAVGSEVAPPPSILLPLQRPSG